MIKTKLVVAVDAPTDTIVQNENQPIIRVQPLGHDSTQQSRATQWNNKLCQCGGKGCCRACCCPLLSLADFAEKSESNILTSSLAPITDEPIARSGRDSTLTPDSTLNSTLELPGPTVYLA